MNGIKPPNLKDLGTPGERLKALRLAAGYANATDAARAMKTHHTTYQHHERGARKVTREKAVFYAAFYRVTAGEILYGEAATILHDEIVEVVGVLGHSGKIVPMPKGSTLPKYVTAPPIKEAQDLLAILVVNNDMFPAYRPGDVIYYEKQKGAIERRPIYGLECVVETEEGEKLIQFVTIQSDGRYTLSAYMAPVLPDVTLVSCSPILWVRKGAIPS